MEEGTSAKGDFLANISHELRTPVTVAKGIAYVLRNPHVSEEERGEFLEQLQTSLDKLTGLVDEIIEISELEQGTFQLNIAYIDLAPLIDTRSTTWGFGIRRSWSCRGSLERCSRSPTGTDPSA